MLAAWVSLRICGRGSSSGPQLGGQTGTPRPGPADHVRRGWRARSHRANEETPREHDAGAGRDLGQLIDGIRNPERDPHRFPGDGAGRRLDQSNGRWCAQHAERRTVLDERPVQAPYLDQHAGAAVVELSSLTTPHRRGLPYGFMQHHREGMAGSSDLPPLGHPSLKPLTDNHTATTPASKSASITRRPRPVQEWHYRSVGKPRQILRERIPTAPRGG
jgi:hypothetical protein